MHDSLLQWREFGLAGVILAFVGYCTVWVGRRILGADGLLSQAAARHVRFVDESAEVIQQCAQLQSQMLEAHARHNELAAELNEAVTRLVAAHSNPRWPASACTLHEAALVACDVAKKFADQSGVQCDNELREIRRKLGNRTTEPL